MGAGTSTSSGECVFAPWMEKPVPDVGHGVEAVQVREEAVQPVLLGSTAAGLPGLYSVAEGFQKEEKAPMVSFHIEIKDFKPLKVGTVGRAPLKLAEDGSLRIECLSSHRRGQFGKKGTIIFLHGAGGSAAQYEDMWDKIVVPEGYTIVFVQSPRDRYLGKKEVLKTPWMLPLEHESSYGAAHSLLFSPQASVNSQASIPVERRASIKSVDSNYHGAGASAVSLQIHDNARIIQHVIAELKAETRGGDLWLCGKSQGACLAALVAAAGATQALAGAFVIAGTALSPLESISASHHLESITYEVPSEKKLRKLRLGFYTGKDDVHFTGVPPREEGGTFHRLHDALSPFPWSHEPKYWTKWGATHSTISPSKDGSEFKALFAFVQNQEYKIDENPNNERFMVPRWSKA